MFSRIKTKSRDEDRSPSPAKRRKDSARKSGDVSTSTYSSLKIVTPAYTTPAPPATPDMGGGKTTTTSIGLKTNVHFVNFSIQM